MLVVLITACAVDNGGEIFVARFVNDLGEPATVYECGVNDCSQSEVSNPQSVPPGSEATENESPAGGTSRYLIVGSSTKRRLCFQLEFHTRLNNIRIPMSDGTSC
jgi:hypothetical protein